MSNIFMCTKFAVNNIKGGGGGGEENKLLVIRLF